METDLNFDMARYLEFLYFFKFYCRVNLPELAQQSELTPVYYQWEYRTRTHM